MMRYKQKRNTLHSRAISERIARYYSSRLSEAFQSMDDSEYTMSYGPEVFSEEAMLNISDGEHLSDEEWEKIRSENYETLDDCINDISNFWWKQFVDSFNDFLYRLNRESDSEFTFDDLILDEWHGYEETVSLDYPEDEPYYEELCKALQESGAEAEEATYKQFKNWLANPLRA